MTSHQLTHLVIGQVVAPRGVLGELRVRVETDDPERFHRLPQVFLGESLARFDVRRARVHQGQVLLCLEGIGDRNTAERWRNAYVYVPMEAALPLVKGEYYHHQIVGLTVVSVEGRELGRVVEVLTTGANDVYLIEGNKGELLLPAIKDVILRVDLDEGKIVVRVPDGLR